jgi:hypothetical protein
MPPITKQQRFDPARPVYVRSTQLNAAGRKWEQGQEFPWRKLAIAMRTMVQLVELRRLTHDMPEALRKPAPTEPTEPAAPVAPVAPASSTPVAAPAAETAVPESVAEAVAYSADALAGIDDLPRLQDIAASIGAPKRASKKGQRDAILAHIG